MGDLKGEHFHTSRDVFCYYSTQNSLLQVVWHARTPEAKLELLQNDQLDQ